MTIADRLLLVTHVALKNDNGALSIDDQTAEGLMRWCENFEQVTYAGIGMNEPDAKHSSSIKWVPIASLPCADRLHVVTMPNAYKVQNFLTTYGATRGRLAYEISRSKYLCFTLGALTGDWAAVAGLEAIKQRRNYAVWFDRVEHEVIRSDLPSMPLKRRIKETLSLPVMRYYHRYLIRHSRLGLFQGRDCYDQYSRFTDRGFCVYDTHTKPTDFIGENELRDKIAGILSGDPLQICYIGRAADMKGPLDWLETLAKARDCGVKFQASWIGDGPLLETMRQAIADKKLTSEITLPGFLGDRAEILGRMRQAHLFLFCHKTPESPRCLIESLVSGTPIVGYASAYARDLVVPRGGGEFVPVGDIRALADGVVTLDRNRTALADLVKAAAGSGLRFDEQTVYRERAGLIREKLSAP